MNLPITARVNSKGHLEVGGCDLVEIAENYGTPLFVVDEATLRERCREYRETFKANADSVKILYASKALSTIAVLKIIHEEGLGVDVSSGGEIYTALKAGCDPQSIYVHGNAKTRDEIRYALSTGVTRFVADSLSEIDWIAAEARDLKQIGRIMLRVNPGIEAHTHEYIQTGKIDSKFGIGRGQVIPAIRQIQSQKSLSFLGIHSHIGSQILDPKPYSAEVEVLVKVAREIKMETALDVEELNVGGGIGISYVEEEAPPFLEAYAEKIGRALRDKIKEYKLKMPTLLVEPGRSIVGNAGVTLYSVVSVKEIPHVRTYVMVDGGMADNPRPILYQARYDAMLANKPNQERDQIVTVAGRYCESGDVLIRDLRLPLPDPGDILAVFATGAYNYSMASNYNRVPKPAMVMTRNGESRLVIRRQTYDDLIREEDVA